MTDAVAMVEVWRGPILESVHHGHAVVCNAQGEIIEGWGDPDKAVLSRSASKMIQALPLVRSGAADAFGLTPQHLALACSSHKGMAIHTDMVAGWLEALGLSDDDLRCGAHYPYARDVEMAMISAGKTPCQKHNNCSGKHSGFLTLAKHVDAGPEYLELDHPVQKAVFDAYEETSGDTPYGYGIDGCSAPNFATSLRGMGRAMAHFASSQPGSAEARLQEAMRAHPEYVAGEGFGCTDLIRASERKVAVKTGAEGFYIAILPEQKLGVALKIADGASRAAECAIAALLVKLGALEADHPMVAKYMNAPIRNRRHIQSGWIRPAPALL